MWGVATDPAGNRIASVSDDKSVIIWQRESNSTEWKAASTLAGFHERTIFSVDWSKHGDLIVTGAADDVIRIFSNTDGAAAFELALQHEAAHTSDINCVRWSPEAPQTADGKRSLLLASAADDALVRIWRFTWTE